MEKYVETDENSRSYFRIVAYTPKNCMDRTLSQTFIKKKVIYLYRKFITKRKNNMLTIEFNDQKFSIPESWADLCLADYERWFKHVPEDKMEYVRMVANICKIDPEVLLNAPTQLFDVISNAIQFIFNVDFSPATKVSIGGQSYFISVSDKLTLGEWIDIEEILNSDSETKISETLAIVCRPAGEEYNTETAARRKEVFRSLPCDKALPLVAFFLHRKKQSEAILHHYSTVVAQANQFLKDTKTFVINGGGIKRLPIWQRIRYIYLTKSLEKQLSKFSDSSFTGWINRGLRMSSISLRSR